jgi:TonB-linked SusC/RagA family outer membrane protein
MQLNATGKVPYNERRSLTKKLWHMMRFTAFLLFAGCLQLSAKGWAQEITLSEKGAPLEKVIRDIQKQSNYAFFYDHELLQKSKSVTLTITRKPFLEALQEVFRDQPLTYEIIGNKIVTIKEKDIQKDMDRILFLADTLGTVQGKVTNEKGEPIVGASIRVKESNEGTVTDALGNFNLKVSKNAVLEVSYLGYEKKEVAVNGLSVINISLSPSTTGLDQLVVVGYGTQKKSGVLGAIVQVDSKELQTGPTANLSSMLQGRLPGLVTKQTSGQPGSDGSSLLVRGLSTLGDNSPLVIVDGIPRPFPNVNPDEIATITVLKDAASAAVYGVRAAHGVILITTKRGNTEKPSITFHSSMSISRNTDFPRFLNGEEYAYWYDKAQELDGVPDNALRFTQDQISRIKNGDPQHILGNTDWFGLLFKDYAPAYTNNISLRGGTSTAKYFVSLGSYNQQGIVDRTSYDRYDFRANLDVVVAKNLSLAADLAGRTSDTKEPGLSAGVGNQYASIFSQAMLSYPFLLPYTPEGLPVGSQNPSNGNQNPLAARDLSGTQDTRAYTFESSMSLKYKLPMIPGLELKVNGAYDKGYSMKKSALLPYKLMVYNEALGTYNYTYARHALGGQASINQWFADNWTTTLQSSISYNNRFNKHAISGLLLYEYTQTKGTSMSAGKKGFPIEDIMDLSYGEQVIDDLIKGGHNVFQRAGYVSRINYSYDDKYLFEFTGRVDGTPNFPRNKRWGVFPAVALGWRISNEPFFKSNVDFVDDLKLRASVGRLGNDAIGQYMYLSTMSLGKDPVVMIGDKLSRPLTVDRVPNPDITWETTSTYNAGFESDLWKGLLGVDFDVFYMVTKNILQAQSGLMPPTLGGYFPSVVNSGIVDNRGFELTLTHANHIGEFNYNIKGNVSWARNKIIKTTEDPNVPDYMKVTGHPIGEKYGFIAMGLFQSDEEIKHSAVFGPTLPGDVRLKDLNGDGRITFDQDWAVTGRSNTPEMMFGLNVGANYKNFDFNVFFQGAALCDVWLAGLYSDRGFYDNTFYTQPFWSGGNTPYYLVEGSWRPDHTNAKYPRLGIATRSNGGKMSSLWVINGSYLRLKTAQIGYTLPKALLQKINIQEVRFYLSGSNLLTWDHLPYLDPEMPDVNQGYYPQQRLYEFGLYLTF